MFALVDCNSFFASVERVFHPGLAGKPVCVLSSNDGIIVALTPEAKALGLHRGDPLFKVKEIVERNGVSVFSGNMMLYAAMSRRVTGIIRGYVPKVENYSIDESFCDLSGCEKHHDLQEYMRGLAGRIRLWTDIPVSIGVAPTRTLAKIGSKFAKQYPGYRSVCMIDSEERRRKALELFDLTDVWGIGRQTCARLMSLGIHSPLEFADRPLEWVERHFTKPAIQTWKELNGFSCIDTSEAARRQSITTSRSFGEMTCVMEEVRESVACFAASCATTLRGQDSLAGSVTVFLCSNRFREDLPQYFNSATFVFPVETADTVEITRAALGLFDTLYRPGIMYKKSGVILGGIVGSDPFQPVLFDPVPDREERSRLSHVMDTLNRHYGLKTVHLAAEGDRMSPWKVRSDHRSPDYLTSLEDILTIYV